MFKFYYEYWVVLFLQSVIKYMCYIFFKGLVFFIEVLIDIEDFLYR